MQLRRVGLHFVDMIYTDAQIANHMSWLRRLRPAWINVLGGAQYREALQFALTVRRDLPHINVIFRHYKDGSDDGMHTRLSASDWIAKIGALYADTGLYILTDNESAADDYTNYTQWHVEALRLAAQRGVKLAVGRFPTHHPRPDQFAQLLPMFAALRDYGGVWSPNAYYCKVPYTNLDGLQRVADLRDFVARELGCEPAITLGEFARTIDLDPHRGYKAERLNGTAYAQEAAALLRQYGLTGSVYSRGEWPIGRDTFGVDDDFLAALEAQKEEPPVIVVNINPGVEDARWQPYTARATGSLASMIRQSPSVSSAAVGSLTPGQDHSVHHIPYDALTDAEKARAQQADYRWHVIKTDANIVGWMRQDVVALTPKPITPPAPEPEPEPEPKPTDPDPDAPPVPDDDWGPAYNALRLKIMEVEARMAAMETRMIMLIAQEVRANEDALLTEAARQLVALIDARTRAHEMKKAS